MCDIEKFIPFGVSSVGVASCVERNETRNAVSVA